MIGEDSASIYGGELALPVLHKVLPPKWSDLLTFSYGAVPDADEEAEEEFGPEPQFEGERAVWQDWLATVDYTLTYTPNDVERWQFGASAAWGKNEFERHTQVYGAHFEYLWRPGGVAHVDSCCQKNHDEFFRWRTEVLVRHFGAVGEEEAEVETTEIEPGTPAVTGYEPRQVGVIFVSGVFRPFFRPVKVVKQAATPARKVTTTQTVQRTIRDQFTDAGVHTTLSYGFPNGKVQAHLRGEYVSGVSEAGLSERYRVSPALTWRPSDELPVLLKLQYNYDHFTDLGDEHSVWFQFSVTWGDCCSHEM
jgi:hypothetical protein